MRPDGFNELASTFLRESTTSAQIADVGINPTEEFLLETLIPCVRLRSRNDTACVSVRRWQKSIRAHQIRAMQCVKRRPTAAFVERIAIEIIEVVERIIGVGNFGSIVPVPPGSSGDVEGLSVRIAMCIGERCGLVSHRDALVAPESVSGRSHPKKSKSLKPYRLGSAATGPVLLIDDVVTSGRHLELARQALTPHPAFSVAWIGA